VGLLLSACIGAASALCVTITTHHLSRKGKISYLRVTRGYDLAEDIARKLEKINNSYAVLEAFWINNFGKVKFGDAIEHFNAKEDLFEELHVMIEEQTDRCDELSECTRGAWFYLPAKLINYVDEYLAQGAFNYNNKLDGDLSHYRENFIKNLMDPENRAKRVKLYTKIKRGFYKLRI